MMILIFKVWLSCAFVMLLLANLQKGARDTIEEGLKELPEDSHTSALIIIYGVIAFFSPILIILFLLGVIRNIFK